MTITLEQLSDALQGAHWRLPKSLVQNIGIEPTLLLMDLFSKYRYFRKKGRLTEDGFFFNVQESIERDTTLSPFKQTKIVEKLEGLGLLMVKRNLGLPAKNYYKISVSQLLSYLGTSEKEIGAHNKNKRTNKNNQDKTFSRENVCGVSGETPGSSPPKGPSLPSGRKPLGKQGTKLPAKKPTKTEQAPDYDSSSADAREVVNHWNGKKPGRPHNIDTMIVRGTLKRLDGGLLERYKKRRIKRAMDDYFMMLRSDSYRVPGGRVDLHAFFEMNAFQKKRRRDAGHPTKTWFRRLVRPGGCMEYFVGDNDDPDLVSEIKKRFVRLVLGEEPKYGWNAKQETDFISCANKLGEYMRGGRMDGLVEGMKPEDHVRVMFEALAANWEDGFTTGNLASPYTFSDVLPRFITVNYEGARSPEIVYEVVPDEDGRKEA